jgi:nucleotide-binding universal stress UspA family protein
MEQKIYLAYDGSTNADWVSRYAVNMAGNSKSQQLTLLHVNDGLHPLEKIRTRIKTIGNECQLQGIEFTSQIAPISTDVYRTLLEIIPASPTSYCICGTRIKTRDKEFLAGTVSEKLLGAKKFNMLAIRVVNPDINGRPGELLFPLADYSRGFEAAMPFLMMLLPSVRKLHLVRIMNPNPLWFQYLSGSGPPATPATDREYFTGIMTDIREETEEYAIPIDSEVIRADDWAGEIINKAGSEGCEMILLGASDRLLPTHYFPGNKIEQILKAPPCDVGIYLKIPNP